MKNFLKNNKQFLISAIVFSLLGTGVTFALPYVPSDAELDPTCAPGDANCYVDIGGITIGSTSISSGTANAVLFEGSGNLVSEDATNFTFDDSTNELYAKYMQTDSTEYQNSSFFKAANQTSNSNLSIFAGRSIGSGGAEQTTTSTPSSGISDYGGIAIGQNIMSSTTTATVFTQSILLGSNIYNSTNQSDGSVLIAIGTNIGGTGHQNQSILIGQDVMANSSATFGYNSSHGHKNVAIGRQAMSRVNSGLNTSIGVLSLAKLTTGGNNTAIGAGAGNGSATSVQTGLTGSSLTFLGAGSTWSVDAITNATAVGAGVNLEQSNSVILGSGANVGIGDATPTALLTVGSGDLFQVNSSGVIAAAAGITSSGSITFSGLGGGGTQCLQADNDGLISGTTTSCATAWDLIGDPTTNGTINFGETEQVLNWSNFTNALDGITFNFDNDGLTANTDSGMILNNAFSTRISGDINTENILLIQQLDTTTFGTTVVDNFIKIDVAASSGGTDGIEITNSAGNLTNGINIVDTAGGTLATGIMMSGTFTNILDTPTVDISNAGAITGVTGYTQNGGLISMTTDRVGFAAEFFNDGDATTRSGILIQGGLDDSNLVGPSTLVEFRDGDGGTIGSISFSSAATAYNTTSDMRLKQNVTDSTLTISDLMNIKIRDYTWIADSNNTLARGVLAQELYEVYPSAVTKPVDEQSGTWMVDYSKLTPLVIKAVQDIKLDMDTKFTELSSLDTTLANSFGNRMKTLLADAQNGIENVYAKIINADKVKTKELCVGDVCVTENQFLQMMQASGAAGSAPINTPDLEEVLPEEEVMGGETEDIPETENTEEIVAPETITE